jgi:two-component system chemotaxis response regulator CheB
MPSANGANDRRIRVLVTAGSTVALNQLVKDLTADRSLEVCIATSIDDLWREVETDRPSVLLLDTRIAGTKTAELARALIQRARLPILLRTENEISAGILLDAIDAGALAILNKPTSDEELAREIPALIWSIKAASGASILNLVTTYPTQTPTQIQGSDQSILAIGAGMGGVLQMTQVLENLPAGAPAAVVIAPLPQQLIAPWADRLSGRCQITVKTARNGDLIKPGQVLIAPGNGHLLLRRSGSEWRVQIKDGPALFQNKPSIEMLFHSIADSAALQAVGLLLSGAGIDGIAGLLQLRKAGGRTLTEAPEHCVFPDLPRLAIQCGAAEASASPNELANKLLEFAGQLPAPGIAA